MINGFLGKQYQSLLILILLAMLAVFAVTGYIAINNIVSEQSRLQQQAISPVYSLVNRELLKPLHIAETFAETITFESLLQEPVDTQKLLTQLANMEERLNLTFFVALDKPRVQLMSNGRQFDLIEGKVYWYFQALESDKRIIADLGQVGDVHLYFDVKIYDEDGTFLGFVGVGKRIRSFVESFSQYKEQFGYDFLFVNEQDQVILTSLPDLQVTNEYIPYLTDLPWFEDGEINMQSLDSEIATLNSEDVLISEIEIPQLSWRLLLLTPLETRQAKLTKTFIINAILASTAIIIVITVMFMAFITFMRRLEKNLETDTLTGLSTRRYLQRRYQQIKRRAHSVCVVVADIDHFKSINDSYGHSAGDIVLQKAAEQLSSVLRSEDVVCRWGGEEFVFLIPNLPADACFSLVERARERLQQSEVNVDGNVIRFTASFGIRLGQPGEQLSKLLANADIALYESKRNGRNCTTQYKD